MIGGGGGGGGGFGGSGGGVGGGGPKPKRCTTGHAPALCWESFQTAPQPPADCGGSQLTLVAV